VPAHVSAAATVGGLCVALAWGWARLLESLNIGLQPQLYWRNPGCFRGGRIAVLGSPRQFHYVLIASNASQNAERRSLEAGLLAREAELKALRAQRDPHFLFNSLKLDQFAHRSRPGSCAQDVSAAGGFPA